MQTATTQLLVAHETAFAARKLRAKRGPPSGGNATQNPITGLAPDTQVNYRRRGLQLLRDAREAGANVWQWTRSRTPGASWYTAKASLQMVVFEETRAAKRDIDKLMPSYKLATLSPNDTVLLQRRISDLGYFATALDTMPTSPLPKPGTVVAALTPPTSMPALLAVQPPAAATLTPGALATSSNTKTARASKAGSLRNLPGNWREQVAIGLPPSAAFLWMVQVVTGCRPKELDMGMTVALSLDRTEITFRVAGAKVTEHAGQPLRTLTYATNTRLTKMLANWLLPGGREVVAMDRTREAYRKIVSRQCKKLWPNRSGKTMPSVYSARHQAKSDMKALGMSQVNIAQALGHSGTASQSYYGGSGKSSGAVAPTSVQATRRIKIKVGFVAKAAASKQAKTKVASLPAAGALAAARKKHKP